MKINFNPSQVDYKRNFTATEEAERFEIFKRQVKEVEEHNKKFEKGEVSWTMGINQFSDRKEDEKLYFGLSVPDSDEDKSSEEETDLKTKWREFKVKFFKFIKKLKK